jgi:hypothetical protein
MKLHRLAVAATVATALLGVTGAQASFADSRVNGDGVGASFQSWSEKFRLWDNGCDGHQVYIVYTVTPENGPTGPDKRLDYDGGCRTMGLFDLAIEDGSSVQWKACVNRQFLADRCSFWEADDA